MTVHRLLQSESDSGSYACTECDWVCDSRIGAGPSRARLLFTAYHERAARPIEEPDVPPARSAPAPAEVPASGSGAPGSGGVIVGVLLAAVVAFIIAMSSGGGSSDEQDDLPPGDDRRPSCEERYAGLSYEGFTEEERESMREAVDADCR